MSWIGLLVVALLTSSPEFGAIEDSPVDVLQVPEEDLHNYWVPRRSPRASYPGPQRRRGTEGCVRMGFIIEPTGNIGFVEVLWSVPAAVFERAAQGAMRRWRFDPAGETAPDQPIYSTHTMVFFPRKNPQSLTDLAELCLPPDPQD